MAEGQLIRRLLDVSSATPDLIRYVCAATRCTEVDDIDAASCTTVGSVVVPAAIVTGGAGGASERDVLCGIVAGYEAMIRLGLAVDGAIRLYDGIWPTYLTAPFGAAAAVARVRRLDAEGTAHSLAIAASRSTGITARAGGPRSPRWFDAGCAAADGYWAAEVAAAGMLGDLNLLEQGFQRAVRVDFDAGVFAAEPDRWRILDIDAKPFCTARQGLSATDAFLQILDEHSADGIERVDVWVPGQVRAMVDVQHPPIGVPAQFALAVHDRLALWDVKRVRKHDHATLGAFMAKVRIQDDERFTSLFPRKWGGRVAVHRQDGTSLEREVLDPRGSAGNPLDWDGLRDKHRRIAEACQLDDAWLEPAYSICRDFGRDGASRGNELLKLMPNLLG